MTTRIHDGKAQEKQVSEESGTAQKSVDSRSWTYPFLVIRRTLSRSIFSSLTRRILYLNLAALVVLLSGILYLNQFREGLIDARVEAC